MTQAEQALSHDEEMALEIKPPGDDASMTKALVPVGPDAHALTASAWPTLNQFQTIVKMGSYMPRAAGLTIPKSISTPEAAISVLLAGMELHVGPMTALRHIAIVNGRAEPDAQLMLGICMAKEPSARFIWHRHDADGAKLELRREGKPPMVAEYLYADAQASGAAKQVGPWKTHQALMLAYNVIKIVCKLGAPDLINAIDGPGAVPSDDDNDDDGDWDSITVEATESVPFAIGAAGTSSPAAARQGTPAPLRMPTGTEIKEEMARQNCFVDDLEKLVGGNKNADVQRWMRANPTVTLEAMIERAVREALVDPETGELPPAEPTADSPYVDGEFSDPENR